MNKILRYSFVALMAMFMGNAFAQKEVVVDFNSMSVATSSGDSDAGDINETYKIVADDDENVVILISPKAEEATNPNRFWQTNSGPQLRCYSGTITIQAKFAMKSITFDAPSKWNLSANIGTCESKKWTGEATEVVFTVNGNTQMNKITISGEAAGNTDPDPNNQESSPENPLTVGLVKAIQLTAEALQTYDVESSPFYVKGKICKIKEVSTQYGNASFYISDDGTETDDMYVFRCKYLENGSFTAEDQIKVGDEVIIYGSFVLYKGNNEEATPEIKNCYIYSLNGKTKDEGGQTPDNPATEINVAKALEIIAALENGKTTAETYQIKGIVAAIDEISLDYGNATFDIVDNTGDAAVLKVFRAKDAEGQKITDAAFVKVGDVVVVEGKLQKYVKNDVITPEVAQNGKILSVNGAAGINDLKADKADGAVYNLAGQRVDANYKGVVIQNGKKFMVK